MVTESQGWVAERGRRETPEVLWLHLGPERVGRLVWLPDVSRVPG